MRISDWSSDVCSSDLLQDDVAGAWAPLATLVRLPTLDGLQCDDHACHLTGRDLYLLAAVATTADFAGAVEVPDGFTGSGIARSEEHTSELQSLMRISYAVFCLKKKNNLKTYITNKTKHT